MRATRRNQGGKRMHSLVRSGITAVVLLAATVAQAQTSYPERPIHLVVAFVAGGATDTGARQIANDLKEVVGQTVVGANRPGANGYLAWTHRAGSEADGYTLLLAENALGISQALHKKATSSFDPLAQYDAVAALAISPSALMVANSVPANNVAELVALSRTVPQKMNFGSAGVGSVSPLPLPVVKGGRGHGAVHVPYKGGGQVIGDVIAGHVPMAMGSVQVVKSMVEAGKLRAFGVTSAARSPALPNVPTLREAGMKDAGVELGFWFGIFG